MAVPQEGEAPASSLCRKTRGCGGQAEGGRYKERKKAA